MNTQAALQANDRTRAFLIAEDETLRTALRLLCANGRHVVFAVNGGRLVGSLSDGDVRRFLLAGGDLDAGIGKAANFKPKFLFSTERERADAFLAENRISAVPIVDEGMNVLDVVFMYDIVDVGAVSIREIGHDDLGMVIEFFDQMAGDTRAMFNRGDVNRIRVIEHVNRKGDDGQVHFAATVKSEDGAEKMVGYVFLWDVDKSIPWLGIAVREDWKGHHLGRRLLQHIDDWAKPRGYGGIMLTSVPANIRAHSLYARMGFEYFGVYPDSEFLFIKRYAR